MIYGLHADKIKPILRAYAKKRVIQRCPLSSYYSKFNLEEEVRKEIEDIDKKNIISYNNGRLIIEPLSLRIAFSNLIFNGSIEKWVNEKGERCEISYSSKEFFNDIRRDANYIRHKK